MMMRESVWQRRVFSWASVGCVTVFGVGGLFCRIGRFLDKYIRTLIYL